METSMINQEEGHRFISCFIIVKKYNISDPHTSFTDLYELQQKAPITAESCDLTDCGMLAQMHSGLHANLSPVDVKMCFMLGTESSSWC